MKSYYSGGGPGLHVKEFGSRADAEAALEEFLAVEMPKVGDYVRKNKFGANQRWPQGNQAAKVVEVFESARFDKDGNVWNGVIAVSIGQNIAKSFATDLRCYEPVGKTPKNLVSLMRRKR